MPITFNRLQEYLDAIVDKAGGDVEFAPHGRFWSTYDALTQQPLPSPRCQGQPIFAVAYTDAAKTVVDADNSPLFVILTKAAGFCGKEQMPPNGGPYVTDHDYVLTLKDASQVPGSQVITDIHEWLAAGAKNT
jgi:hypothetical protein